MIWFTCTLTFGFVCFLDVYNLHGFSHQFSFLGFFVALGL